MNVFHTLATKIENTESAVVFATLFPFWYMTVWFEFQVENIRTALAKN